MAWRTIRSSWKMIREEEKGEGVFDIDDNDQDKDGNLRGRLEKRGGTNYDIEDNEEIEKG